MIKKFFFVSSRYSRHLKRSCYMWAFFYLTAWMLTAAIANSQTIAESNWELLLEKNAEEVMVVHQDFNPLFWQNSQLNEDVGERLYRLGQFYFQKLSDDMPGVKLSDIVFIGSMADYLYTSHSDLDMNLIIDTANVHWPTKAITSYLKQNNKYWHTQSMTLFNYPIEIGAYTQISTLGGIYSVLDRAWVKMPEHHVILFSKDALKKVVRAYHQDIDVLQHEYISNPKQFRCERFSEFQTALIKWRKDGLQREGLTSIENISYRLLRILGEIDLVADLAAECLAA